jgi:hypothetical protein
MNAIARCQRLILLSQVSSPQVWRRRLTIEVPERCAPVMQATVRFFSVFVTRGDQGKSFEPRCQPALIHICRHNVAQASGLRITRATSEMIVLLYLPFARRA